MDDLFVALGIDRVSACRKLMGEIIWQPLLLLV